MDEAGTVSLGEAVSSMALDERAHELLDDVRRHWDSPLPDGVAEQMVLDVERDGYRVVVLRVPAAGREPSRALSPREEEIARMVARGYPNKAIASVLQISSWTVSSHIRRIFLKLDVGTRAAMVARLVDLGLLSPSWSAQAPGSPPPGDPDAGAG